MGLRSLVVSEQYFIQRIRPVQRGLNELVHGLLVGCPGGTSRRSFRLSRQVGASPDEAVVLDGKASRAAAGLGTAGVLRVQTSRSATVTSTHWLRTWSSISALPWALDVEKIRYVPYCVG
jgi:hypothetical protein